MTKLYSFDDVFEMIPHYIMVSPKDYENGTSHPSYSIDLAQAKKWNACVKQMISNLNDAEES